MRDIIFFNLDIFDWILVLFWIVWSVTKIKYCDSEFRWKRYLIVSGAIGVIFLLQLWGDNISLVGGELTIIIWGESCVQWKKGMAIRKMLTEDLEEVGFEKIRNWGIERINMYNSGILATRWRYRLKRGMEAYFSEKENSGAFVEKWGDKVMTCVWIPTNGTPAYIDIKLGNCGVYVGGEELKNKWGNRDVKKVAAGVFVYVVR